MGDDGAHGDAEKTARRVSPEAKPDDLDEGQRARKKPPRNGVKRDWDIAGACRINEAGAVSAHAAGGPSHAGDAADAGVPPCSVCGS